MRGGLGAGKVVPPDRSEVGVDRRMPELLEKLRKAVGESHVIPASAVHADYTHDEALTTDPVTPLAVVLPGSTDEVSEVLRLASEHRVPVIARGSGTGLSGAAVPVADGILVAFDRMQRIREIDTENQVAVVEPGVTLEQLNAELAPLGLIYPVSPGEQSGSLGGNVATNAGGMRAVRYGVTRHHVLGLEVGAGRRPVLRTGGKFVKCSTGYDLTQLLIGSEGTLAITTEVTVKVQPRFTGQRRSGALRHAGGGRSRRAAHRAQRHRPVHPRVRRRPRDGRHHRRPGSTWASPRRCRRRTLAYLIVVLEGMDADRVDEDVERLGTLLEELGALDVYVLPAAVGRAARRGPGAGVLRRQGGRLRRPHRRRPPPRRHPRLPRPGRRAGRRARGLRDRAAATSATATST